jgi:hypothetical protein
VGREGGEHRQHDLLRGADLEKESGRRRDRHGWNQRRVRGHRRPQRAASSVSAATRFPLCRRSKVCGDEEGGFALDEEVLAERRKVKAKMH